VTLWWITNDNQMIWMEVYFVIMLKWVEYGDCISLW